MRLDKLPEDIRKAQDIQEVAAKRMARAAARNGQEENPAPEPVVEAGEEAKKGGKTPEKKTVKALSRKEQRQLEDWLKENAARIKEMRPTWPVLVALVSKEVGLDVSRHQVSNACEVIDLIWDHPKAQSGPYLKKAMEATRDLTRALEARVVTLEARLSEMQQLFEVLDADVHALKTSVGKPTVPT